MLEYLPQFLHDDLQILCSDATVIKDDNFFISASGNKSDEDGQPINANDLTVNNEDNKVRKSLGDPKSLDDIIMYHKPRRQ